MSSHKKISTSALAKSKNVNTKSMFELLATQGYTLQQEGGKSELTEKGKSKGGEMMHSKKFGDYIVWPEDINLAQAPQTIAKLPLITATAIGKQFELSANKINYILSELGWVKKSIKGWLATEHGAKLGGVQAEDQRSGVPYVRWPSTIIEVRALKRSIDEVKGTSQPENLDVASTTTEVSNNSFREKFPAKHRSADGHMVRSKAEMLIDNWLYMAEIVHAYERKLPIEEDVYCDFYIPTGKVYIEYWGYDNDEKYTARKQKKISIYKKYGFNLIELVDADVQNLDDTLPRLLLKFGIQAY